VAISQTKRIGVLATRGTLQSAKFQALLASLSTEARFICQPCDGLADAIEHDDTSKTIALCAQYTCATGHFGLKDGEIDTLVLGCTHYPFASQHFAQLLGPQIKLVSNGEPVARHTRRMLKDFSSQPQPGQITLLSTGKAATLQQAANRWLQLACPVQSLS
jgi:glutamate racemase